MQLPGCSTLREDLEMLDLIDDLSQDTSGTSVSGDTQAVGQGGVPAGQRKTPKKSAKPKTRPVGDTGVPTGGPAGGKRGKPTVEKKSTPGPKPSTPT